jgi:NAD(P)-dependent dehydrogenase (short-subunit alcohol dehydrogenase family)
MESFGGRLAVVTGGGMGIGRELARQLAREGCSVAICDLSASAMAEAAALIEQDGIARSVKITSHVVDVSDEGQFIRFREEVISQHGRESLNLLFNNAGVGGHGSFVCDPREGWDKIFAVCWNGVYFGCRTFLPMMMAADAAHIVNTSSANGFWASLGPYRSHTSYCVAKFAVKGFTEALITDLRLNAPHIKCSVVMPGHIGTSIYANSRKFLAGVDEDIISLEYIAGARVTLERLTGRASQMSDSDVRDMLAEQERDYIETAPTTAEGAARIILDGVRAERWRILAGADAEVIDRVVRGFPEEAYEATFLDRLNSEMGSIGATFSRG